jgi:hypothetical protein
VNRTKLYAAALALSFAFTPAAFAQQGDMRGMNMQGQGTGGMDMQAMMNRCAQMRQQMQHGAKMTTDLQRLVAQCDQMDKEMGNMGNTGPAQRTR